MLPCEDNIPLRVREGGAIEPDVHGSSSQKFWVSMELGWEIAESSHVLLVQSMQLWLNLEPREGKEMECHTSPLQRTVHSLCHLEACVGCPLL